MIEIRLGARDLQTQSVHWSAGKISPDMFASIRFVQLEVHVLEDMLVMSMLSFEAEFTNHRAYLALRHRVFHTGEMYLLHSDGGRQNNCHDSLHTGGVYHSRRLESTTLRSAFQNGTQRPGFEQSRKLPNSQGGAWKWWTSRHTSYVVFSFDLEYYR